MDKAKPCLNNRVLLSDFRATATQGLLIRLGLCTAGRLYSTGKNVKYPQISSSLFCLVLLIILATIIVFLFSLTFWLVAGKMEMKSKFVS